jgi:hypothetical protein
VFVAHQVETGPHGGLHIQRDVGVGREERYQHNGQGLT